MVRQTRVFRHFIFSVICAASAFQTPMLFAQGQGGGNRLADLNGGGFNNPGPLHLTSDTVFRLRWSLDLLNKAIAKYPALLLRVDQCVGYGRAARDQAVTYVREQAARAARVGSRDSLLAEAKRFAGVPDSELRYHCLDKQDYMRRRDSSSPPFHYGLGARLLAAELSSNALTPAGLASVGQRLAIYRSGPGGNSFSWRDCFPKVRSDNCTYSSYQVFQTNVWFHDMLRAHELRILLNEWAFCGNYESAGEDYRVESSLDSVSVVASPSIPNKYSVRIRHQDRSDLPTKTWHPPVTFEALDDPVLGVVLTYPVRPCASRTSNAPGWRS